MAPVRRYLRITKYSVLECRIYLDNPALAQSWLLNPRYDVLPRVIESVRPLVLPKLREERERERLKKKASKKSRLKDVIVRDDFEVSFFLMETNTRHSLLTKKKNFREKAPGMIQSNTTRLIDETNEQPVDVDDDSPAPIRLEEDSEEDAAIRLADIPVADESFHAKRDRSGGNEGADAIDVGSDDEVPPTKRRRGGQLDDDSDDDGGDDKKKMALDVSYEGFAIYGRVLCLVVKRTGEKSASQTTTSRSEVAGGQAKMENFLTSTQVPVGEEE